jgi:hypothetical protein
MQWRRVDCLRNWVEIKQVITYLDVSLRLHLTGILFEFFG